MGDELRFKFSSPLNKEDTAEQTYGCRANNPDICKWAYLENVCAFVNTNRICHHPSSAWKKQFYKLGGKDNE